MCIFFNVISLSKRMIFFFSCIVSKKNDICAKVKKKAHMIQRRCWVWNMCRYCYYGTQLWSKDFCYLRIFLWQVMIIMIGRKRWKSWYCFYENLENDCVWSEKKKRNVSSIWDVFHDILKLWLLTIWRSKYYLAVAAKEA